MYVNLLLFQPPPHWPLSSPQVGIHTELYTLLRDKWRGLLGRCSANYISDAKLGDLLRQWAGEDRDAGDEQAAADRRKLLTVGGLGQEGGKSATSRARIMGGK